MTYTPIDLETPADRPDAARVRLLAVVTAALLALGLVGVATVDRGDGPSAADLATVLAAAGRTADATSVRMAAQVHVRLSGDTDLDLPTMSMEGVMVFASRRASLSVKAANLSFEAVSDGALVYVKVPPGGRPRPKPWIAVPAQDNGAAVFQSLTGPSIGGGGDPTATLEAIRADGAVRDVRKTGTARIRGTPTTVFRLVLKRESLAAAMRNNPMMQVLDTSFEDPVLDLSVDAQGLVRRMEMRIEATFRGKGQTEHLRGIGTTDLFDFGTPVTIAIPPPDQVLRLGSVAELAPFLTAAR